ncbi:hypothetical protein CVT24_002919 [Panaeolus cyanescens]|uniref:Uncharacterized protein n=1 Tax=Panaeolus cyanescens TaxID=181874 RepID=A0A409YRQ6_9AGAR|nr:hypothetical protein CVT24_002919 [Panaeolus cyanescens]
MIVFGPPPYGVHVNPQCIVYQYLLDYAIASQEFIVAIEKALRPSHHPNSSSTTDLEDTLRGVQADFQNTYDTLREFGPPPPGFTRFIPSISLFTAENLRVLSQLPFFPLCAQDNRAYTSNNDQIVLQPTSAELGPTYAAKSLLPYLNLWPELEEQPQVAANSPPLPGKVAAEAVSGPSLQDRIQVENSFYKATPRDSPVPTPNSPTPIASHHKPGVLKRVKMFVQHGVKRVFKRQRAAERSAHA